MYITPAIWNYPWYLIEVLSAVLQSDGYCSSDRVEGLILEKILNYFLCMT